MPPVINSPTPPPAAPEHPRRSLLIAGVSVLVLVLLIGGYALVRHLSLTLSGGNAAATTGIPDSIKNRTPWQGMMDYFIQDVCLDKNGNVMMGVSPVDGNPGCVAHRDLLPGERLPYHKENPRDNGDTERLDEFPVDTGGPLGIIAVKIKDNYGRVGRVADELDLGDGIGNVYTQSSTTISTFATIDANGPTFRVSRDCSDAAGGIPNDLNALMNAQGRVTIDALSTTSGTYPVSLAKVYNPGPCPVASDYKDFTGAWKLTKYSYERPDGSKTEPLDTLVSNDADPAGVHFERYYQTKEVGRTRFEAWQNTSKMDATTKTAYEKDAAQLAKSGGDCATPFEPSPGPTWVMYQCGEWTTFAPPTDMVYGDYPDQFIAALKNGNMTAELFGLKPSDNPTITSVTPSSFTYGDPVTLTIKGNFPPHDAQGQVIVMIDGGSVHALETPSADNSTVTYQIVWDNGHAEDHQLGTGTHDIHVFDGVSMSNGLTFTVAKQGGGGGKKNK